MNSEPRDERHPPHASPWEDSEPLLAFNSESRDGSTLPDGNPWEDSQRRQELEPRVTVGMPVYNIEEFLGPTLESVLAQTFEEFEILVFDDHSTDDTGKVARDYAEQDPRVHYYRAPRNLGIYASFNLPMKWARGEYFILAGQDDIWEPDYLERLVQLLDEVPDAVGAMAGLDHIDRHGDVFRRYPRLGELEEETHFETLKTYILHEDAHGKTYLHHGLIRTQVLHDIGGYRRWCERPFGEDTLFSFRIVAEGRIRVDPDCLWHKRWLPTALGSKVWPPRGDTLKERLEGIMIDFYDEYQYMRGYSRIVWTLEDLTTTQKIYLEAAVWWRYLHIFVDKVGRVVRAGLRRLAGRGPKENDRSPREGTD